MKMRVLCGMYGWLSFSLGLLWLAIMRVNGQQIGVSLVLLGQTIPNNSLVNYDDLYYVTNDDQPTNANGEQTLMCVTDLEDCCESPRTVRGNWFYPDGRTVTYNTGRGATFQSNRGANEVRNNQQLNGSVRLWRRYTANERGIFRCELPDASGINQNLYVNILFFVPNSDGVFVTTTPSSDSTIAGRNYSLTCSATLHPNNPSLSDPNIPALTFEWFFGPNGNASLPSGLTITITVLGSDNIYRSILHFSPPHQSHTGMYTCRLGAGRLVNSAMVTVNAPAISVQITTSGALTLGQNGYSLMCSVSRVENLSPSITYQWTKNNGILTEIQVGTDKVLSFSPLRLSDAGRYTCQATVSSPYLNNDITVTDSQNLTMSFQVPPPSLVISSNISNPIRPIGSAVTLNCTVELSPLVDVPVTVNILWTGPAGFTVEDSNLIKPVVGSIATYMYTSTVLVSSFGREKSGNYYCTVNISLISPFLVGSAQMNGTARVNVGTYLSLKGIIYANNSVIKITEIGETNSTSNTGLQCITDRIPCCQIQPNKFGEWYFPDEMGAVPIQASLLASPTSFYRNRGDDGTVNLNRLNTNIMFPTGLFCCVVPDATGVDQNVCANIVSYNITPSTFGTLTTGVTYSLNCSINHGTTDPKTYQWFKGPDSSGMQLTNTSQLQFSSLRASDAGPYTCRANVGGMVTEETTTVTVSLSTPTSVMVTPSVAPIIVGSSINLTCTVELSPLVDVPVTVNTVWTGPDGFMTTNTAAQSVRGNTTTYASTAMVSSSGGEQSGNYTCKATVRAMSSYIIDSVGYSSSKIIVVPEPIVSVHSNSPNQIFTAGYPPTLMCTVETRSVVNIPLSMMIVWKGPDGTAVTPPVKPEMKSYTLYTSSSSLTSVESADSAGEYTCTVSFENGVMISASTNITIVDEVFQLRLKSVDICQKTSDQPKQYSNFIKEALVKAIEHHCKCHFPTVNILNKDLFICEDSPNLVIYRNALFGTLNFNGTQITGFIQDWVNTGPLIEIDGNSVRVDSSCHTAISSLDDPVCGETEECMADVDPKVARCAEHLDNDNIANCFEGCVVRNG